MTAPQASLRVAPGSHWPPARELRSALEQGQGDRASETELHVRWGSLGGWYGKALTIKAGRDWKRCRWTSILREEPMGL